MARLHAAHIPPSVCKTQLSAQAHSVAGNSFSAIAVQLLCSPHSRAQSIVKSVSAFIAGTPDVQVAAGEILCDILSFGNDQQQQ
jgi:hypothetical protein